jgi:hypothetical protein
MEAFKAKEQLTAEDAKNTKAKKEARAKKIESSK